MNKDITLQDESTLKPETVELKRGMMRAYLDSKREERARKEKKNDTISN